MRIKGRAWAGRVSLLTALGCLLAMGCGTTGGGTASTSAGFDTFSAADTGDAPAVPPPGVSAGLRMIVFPDQSGSPVLQAIQGAKKSLDVQMYMITDAELVQGLIAAAKPPRNLKVRVLLDPNPYTGGGPNPNLDAVKAFRGTPVLFDWTSPRFTYTHQKSMIVDKAAVWIMTANMSKSARLTNREYLIIDSNKEDIAEAQQLFDSDWAAKPYVGGPAAPHLVISPDNSRSQLLKLIKSARRTLTVGIETLGDPEVQKALIARAHAKVAVRVLIADPGKSPTSHTPEQAKELQDGGCQVKYLTTPVLHAKVIVVDEAIAYAGSVNLTTNSINNNRELGILISQPDVLQTISQTLNQDWQAGGPIGGGATGSVKSSLSPEVVEN